MTGRFLIVLSLAILAVSALLPGACGGGEQILRTSDRQIITFARMIDEIRGARVIFIGESHDEMDHHRLQLRLIRALTKGGVPLVVGMEMFAATSQPGLDRWVAGELPEREFIGLYYHDWQMPWPYYRDILHYVRRHRLPLAGLNIPRGLAEKVARRGFGALTPEERKQIPPGITCDVDESYMSFIREAYAAHVGSSASFLHFCEAQQLWNRSMARNISVYLAGRPTKSMAVICGMGHALKRAVPHDLEGEGIGSYRVILPEVPELPRDKVTVHHADYLFLRD